MKYGKGFLPYWVFFFFNDLETRLSEDLRSLDTGQIRLTIRGLALGIFFSRKADLALQPAALTNDGGTAGVYFFL